MSVAPEDLALLLPEDAGAIRDSLVALLNLDNANLLAELATAARCAKAPSRSRATTASASPSG